MPSLEFKGKQFIYTHHLSVPFRELVPDAKKSVAPQAKGGDLNDNLIIHGDNLEALKALLPTYAGKVDCIFIDPPYNTGNEGWCYNDKVNSPLMREWLKKEANPVDKEDLERHDKWLCMMWPRLKLLHELLSDDGVLFVTLDDNEQHRLRVILDELFSRDEAFYGQIAWQKKYAPANDAKGFSTMFDHVLVYRKSEEFSRNLLERTDDNDANYRHSDSGGVFRVSDYTCNKTADERPNLYYPVINPNTNEEIWPKKTAVWRYSRERHAANVENDLVWWGKDGKGKTPGFKRYRDTLKGGGGTVPSTWWDHEFAGHTDEAKKEVLEVFPDLPNALHSITPKPVRLLQRILEIATDENSLILDSFAGSGTTAHAVLAMNAKDGGNRRFILIECEDYADELTAERVRRVIGGYTFKGTQRTELMREKLTLTTLKKAGELLEKAESIEKLEGAHYDRVKKEVKDGVFIATGEKDVKEKTEGLGGSFTFCTLGKVMDLETIVRGEGELPDYESLARYVFFTATGRALDTVPKRSPDGFIGSTDLYNLHLHYQPERAWLRGSEAQLHEDHVKLITARKPPGKKALVFAVGKYMSQKTLTPQGVEFCQLPYAIHRMVGG